MEKNKEVLNMEESTWVELEANTSTYINVHVIIQIKNRKHLHFIYQETW